MMRWFEMRGRGVVGAALAAVVVFGATGAARAQSGDVESLLAQGIELRRKGHPERAVIYFQKAYDLDRSPRTEGQLGLGQIAAGDPLEAEKHLTAALESPRDSWVAKYKSALEDALARTRKQLGDLTVDGGPAGASVKVNGRAAGTLPLAAPIRVVAGKVDLEVSAPDHATDTRSLTVGGGAKERVTVTLKQESAMLPVTSPARTIDLAAGPAPGAGANTAATPATTTTPPAGGTLTTSPSGSGSSGMRAAAWGVGAGAAVGLGVGIGLQLAARSKIDGFNNGCVESDGKGVAAPGTSNPRMDCGSVYDSWKTEKMVSIIGYAAGGALAVTSGVLFWMSSSGSHAGVASARLTCAPGPGGVACRGEF